MSLKFHNCKNCGASVKAEAEMCSYCGTFFSGYVKPPSPKKEEPIPIKPTPEPEPPKLTPLPPRKRKGLFYLENIGMYAIEWDELIGLIVNIIFFGSIILWYTHLMRS